MNNREMVDSGVDWIGEIPLNWSIQKVKNIASVSKGSQYDFDPVENPGQTPYINGGINPSWYSSKSNREANLIAISEGGASAGYVQMVKSSWWCGAHCYSVKPSSKNASNFIFWSLKSGELILQEEKTGTAMPNLQSGKLLNLCLPTPPIDEQQSIANFLDHHVNLIDRELSLIDKKIELLGEKRKALIFECVTGKRTVVPRSSLTDTANVVGHGDWVAVPTGNDNLMDSGVDWIGAIPKDWIVNQLKNIVTVQVGKTPNTSNPENFDGGIPWITISDLNDDGTFPVFTKNTLSKHGSKQLKISPKGSILVSFKLSVGKAIIAQKDIYTNEAIATLSFKNLRSNDFLYWSVPDYFYNEASENIYGAKILNQDKIYRIKIVLPSVNEQNLISIFLSQETKIIDREISLLKLKKNLLAEKRRALIFEAVTGKIDCRSWTV